MSLKTILCISKEVWEWVDVFTISNGTSPTSTVNNYSVRVVAVVILFTSSANGCKILKMHMLSSCSAQQTEVKASKKSQLYNLRQATLKCTNYERYTLRLIYLTRKFHTCTDAFDPIKSLKAGE